MNNTQKIITVLLILAIVFSATSIFISLSVSNLEIPSKAITGKSVDNGGGIKLFVEGEEGENGR